MIKTCSSCGEFVNSDEQYAYCDSCEVKRNDKTLRPIVWEYIGGKLGCLPNQRGSIEHTIQSFGFELHSHLTTDEFKMPVYVRQQTNSPTGLLAIVTLDKYLVILGGKFELESLWNHHDKFRDNPVIDNVPKWIESLNPERVQIVEELQRKAGLLPDTGSNL